MLGTPRRASFYSGCVWSGALIVEHGGGLTLRRGYHEPRRAPHLDDGGDRGAVLAGDGVSYTLLHGDCLDLLPTLPDRSVDAVITDPPYGIGGHRAIHCTKPDRPNTYITAPKYEAGTWDNGRPAREVFDEILRISRYQIIWGGNYFADMLPASRGWLFWDKRFENTTNFSHGELAWTSLDMRLRKFTLSSKAETRGGRDRVHPTQKPVALMRWCLSFLPEGCTVIDPFMGSGSTGVACVEVGYNFIGIEKDATYYAIAQKRIADAEAARVLPLFEVAS